MKRVVLVEDSFIIRRQLTQLLDGFKVYATADVHQALNWLDKHKIKYLILNPLLSKNSGLELLYELNSWLDLRLVKTILLTHDDLFFKNNLKTLKELNVVKVLKLNQVDGINLTKALNF